MKLHKKRTWLFFLVFLCKNKDNNIMKLSDILTEMDNDLTNLYKKLPEIEKFISNLFFNPVKITNHPLFNPNDKKLLAFFLQRLSKDYSNINYNKPIKHPDNDDAEPFSPKKFLELFIEKEQDFIENLFLIVWQILIKELIWGEWGIKANNEITNYLYMRIKSSLFNL